MQVPGLVSSLHSQSCLFRDRSRNTHWLNLRIMMRGAVGEAESLFEDVSIETTHRACSFDRKIAR